MLHPPPKYTMNYISNFLAIRNAATASSVAPSSPSNNANHSNEINCDLDETQLDSINGTTGSKSFTIAAILGLKKKNAAAAVAAAIDQTQKSKEMSVMNLSTNLNIHNQQHQHMMPAISHHIKGTFNNFDNVNDTRLMPNRIPLAFGQHINQHHHTHHNSHFLSNNNNNNNNHTINSNATSALQSLQQQFHQKNNQNLGSFHGKEHRIKNDHITKSKSSLKSKRVRTIFTPEQLERLEAEFERQQYMVGPERLYLAHTLQLTEAQVKVWFQNRRIKWRKHHLEMTQQRLAIIRQRQLPTTNNVSELQSTEIGANDGASGSVNATTSIVTQQSASSLNPISIDSELSVCTDSTDSNSLQDNL